tara:strand:+ start:1285 stop:1539 length:255 start_codon:yes stop_codon:yes gene_type:complete
VATIKNIEALCRNIACEFGRRVSDALSELEHSTEYRDLIRKAREEAIPEGLEEAFAVIKADETKINEKIAKALSKFEVPKRRDV